MEVKQRNMYVSVYHAPPPTLTVCVSVQLLMPFGCGMQIIVM